MQKSDCHLTTVMPKCLSFDPGAENTINTWISQVFPKKTKPQVSQSLSKKDVPHDAPAPRQDLGPQEPGLQCGLCHLHVRGPEGNRRHRREHHPEHQVFPGARNDELEAGDAGDREGDYGCL